MQPSEALSASAQVAVALAGFAGVVVAFRNRSVHEWSKIDKFRLRILLTNSAIPFVLSILGMVLSSTSLDLAIFRRDRNASCSGDAAIYLSRNSARRRTVITIHVVVLLR